MSIRLAVLFGLCFPILIATAQPITQNDLFYYEIGGAAAVSPSANPGYLRNTLSSGAALRWGYSCGRFSAEFSVENILNDIANSAEVMVDNMVIAAQAAIANLPAYILQRANPGLYDLFMNGLLKAEESVAIAFKTCEAMERDITNGQNPYDDWIRISMNHNWRSQGAGVDVTSAQDGEDGDVVTARETVEREGGENGVPWLGGEMRGGAGQEPIHIVGDVVQAGYNAILNRDVTDTGPAPTTPPLPRLVELWPEPDEAREWAIDVLGERHITTCHDCAKDAEAGVGLLLQIERDQPDLLEAMDDLIDGSNALVHDNLKALAAPGIAISTRIVEILRRLPPIEQAVSKSRLINEIATARAVERAMLVRRLLLSGRRTPEVQAADAALEAVDHLLHEMEREIESLAFEKRIRQDLVSQTATALIRYDIERLRESVGRPRRPFVDEWQLRHGEVRPPVAE